MKHIVSVSLDEETIIKIREILRDKNLSYFYNAISRGVI